MEADLRETPESVRQQGNTEYKAGNFDSAVELYRKAAELAPEDYKPLSNLSSALFEQGDYLASDKASISALSLLQDRSQDASVKQKIYARQARARLAMARLCEAEEAVDQLDDGPDKTKLKHYLKTQDASLADVSDPVELHTRLILNLPRYKSMMYEAHIS